MSELKRTIYVGIVPLWLAETLNSKGVPVDDAMFYDKLSAIISAEEVCFYHAYNTHFNSYVGNDFDDMLKVYQEPSNIAWLNEHAAELQRATGVFKHAFSMNADKLALQSSPKTIRLTNYKPTHTSSDGLLLVGNGPAADYDREVFTVGCIQSLELILPLQVYNKLKIFSVYTRIRR